LLASPLPAQLLGRCLLPGPLPLASALGCGGVPTGSLSSVLGSCGAALGLFALLTAFP
jgi:hypothetical protein